MSKLTKGQKIAYGICRFGTSIFMNVATLATIWIYDNVYGLKDVPYMNATAVAIGKIIIAFSGFIFGYISDIIPGKKIGRRKFFIWTGAPLLALSFVMLFIPHLFISSDQTIAVFVWLLVWNSMFNLFYGYLLTPYQSWMTEVTTEDDRVQMSGIQNTTNLFSSLLGTGFVFLIPGLLGLEEGQALSGTSSTVLIIIILVFAVIEVAVFLPALFMVKDEKVERKERKIMKEFKVVLTNKNYVIWFMGQGVYSMGLTLITALVLDFATDILGFTGITQTVIFGLSVFGTVMLCFAGWAYLSKKIGKKWALVAGFGFLALVLPLSALFIVLLETALTVMGYVYGFLIGLGLSAPYLFPYAIIADIADKDERVTKESRAGMYNGFNSIPLNIFQAIALILVGYLGNEYYVERLYWLGPIAAAFIAASLPILILGNFDPFRIPKNDIQYGEKVAPVSEIEG
ncbi:MAG TPA: MFS transporter [candidate division Zixibacteria bacterium]|nr:MFS transporter [candidate division Zixibacteria bacterium]